MAGHNDPGKTWRATGRRTKKKPRNLETTVSKIAQHPAPIRRSIFDLLDTLISSRERASERDDERDEPVKDDDSPTGPDAPPERKNRRGRAPGNPGSR